MLSFDTESCGFHGPTVLIQYKIDDQPVQLHNVFTNPVNTTLSLIEKIVLEDIVGFNLAFDWFHICQTYNTLRLLPDYYYPIDHIEEYAYAEKEARDGPCLKPKGCLDLMLHARKGPYQSTMDRKDITIKRVPTPLAYLLKDELNKRIPLKDVYFARKKDKKRWEVYDIRDFEGEIIPELKDLKLKFSPSSGLKAITEDALGVKEATLFEEVSLHNNYKPVEVGYAPFALAIGDKNDWKGAWPEVIHEHISHWEYNKKAREYATNDVVYTEQLYHFFAAREAGLSEFESRKYAKNPTGTYQLSMNDDDSVLSCMVAAVRWRGFKIDEEKIKALRSKCEESLKNLQVNPNQPKEIYKWLTEGMSDTEKLILKGSTKKQVLKDLQEWKETTICEKCEGMGCEDCEDGLTRSDKPHPVAEKAKIVADARLAKYKINNLNKLLQAGRFHATYSIIGTKSSRMSGSGASKDEGGGGDGYNSQGVSHETALRECFPLAFEGEQLCGGDFDGFEISIAESVYDDPKLHEDLTRVIDCPNCKGVSGLECGYCNGEGATPKKFHCLMAMSLWPDKTYEEIVKSKGTSEDLYDRGKRAGFAKLYGGNAATIENRIEGVSLEAAERSEKLFEAKYEGVKKARLEIEKDFCSMRQPGGLGTKVEWNEPKDYVESFLGFKRYFTLENRICRELFNLANDPPKHFNQIRVKIVRRPDRGEQLACNAVRSALFAAAFGLQGANMRAAANHQIQSPGSQVTKRLQCALWELQPSGVHEWIILPFNTHDEVLAPTKKGYEKETKRIANKVVEHYKRLIPLIGMTWKTNLKSWAGK